MVFLPLEKVGWGCEAWNSCRIFVGKLGSIPGLGRSPRGGNSYPLQCSDLENSMDCVVHGVIKRQKRLRDFQFLYFGALPTGSSVGKESACSARDLGSIPGSGRSPGERNGYPLQYPCLENPMDRGPGGVQSTGSQRVGHDWVTNTFTFWYKGEEQGWEGQACHRKESRGHWYRDTGPLLEDTENVYIPDTWVS